MPSNTVSLEPEKTCEDQPASEAPERERWAFRFSVSGDLRFISHRDTVRLFQRALARASLPVRYSEGFNPHPRLSLPLPRPVGVGSEAETIIIEFESPIDGDDALDRLNAQMPAQMHLSHANRLAPGDRLLPDLVRYRIEPPGGCSWPADFVRALAIGIKSVMEREILYIDRQDGSGSESRRVDVRAFLDELSLEGDAVEFALRVTPAGSARPREVAALLGFDGDGVGFEMRRTAVRWQHYDQ